MVVVIHLLLLEYTGQNLQASTLDHIHRAFDVLDPLLDVFKLDFRQHHVDVLEVPVFKLHGDGHLGLSNGEPVAHELVRSVNQVEIVDHRDDGVLLLR